MAVARGLGISGSLLHAMKFQLLFSISVAGFVLQHGVQGRRNVVRLELLLQVSKYCRRRACALLGFIIVALRIQPGPCVSARDADLL